MDADLVTEDVGSEQNRYNQINGSIATWLMMMVISKTCFIYILFVGALSGVAPIWIPRLALQCMAAPLGGASTTFITTPMDAIRARIQVKFSSLSL